MCEKFRKQFDSYSYSDSMENTGIKIDGHRGTWYIIDTLYSEIYGKILILLEHETWGDETCALITDLEGNVILDEVWNGFEDLEEFLEYPEQL